MPVSAQAASMALISGPAPTATPGGRRIWVSHADANLPSLGKIPVSIAVAIRVEVNRRPSNLTRAPVG
jgi:hypothetical protein